MVDRYTCVFALLAGLALVTGCASQPTTKAPSAATVSTAATASSDVETPQVDEDGFPVLPELDPADRRGILEALRVPLEKALGQRLTLKIRHLAVSPPYAIVFIVPRTLEGAPIDYARIAKFSERAKAGVLDEASEAVLEKRNGEWTVLEYRVGPTDTKIGVWTEKYGIGDPAFEATPDEE